VFWFVRKFEAVQSRSSALGKRRLPIIENCIVKNFHVPNMRRSVCVFRAQMDAISKKRQCVRKRPKTFTGT
jgi:hypothetical protein